MDLPSFSVYYGYQSRGYGSHCLRMTMGPISVWFSYNTVVAFRVAGGELVQRKNDWGPTTGKHLNAICANHDDRVDADEFKKRWDEQVEPILKAARLQADRPKKRRREPVTA